MRTISAKPPILLSLLLFASCSASAEWVKVSKNDESTFYIDQDNIRKNGNLRKVWSIEDLNQRNQAGVKSKLMRTEYDCKDERGKGIALSTHSESMGQGTTIDTLGEDTRGWREIPPTSATDIIMKIACAR